MTRLLFAIVIGMSLMSFLVAGLPTTAESRDIEQMTSDLKGKLEDEIGGNQTVKIAFVLLSDGTMAVLKVPGNNIQGPVPEPSYRHGQLRNSIETYFEPNGDPCYYINGVPKCW